MKSEFGEEFKKLFVAELTKRIQKKSRIPLSICYNNAEFNKILSNNLLIDVVCTSCESSSVEQISSTIAFKKQERTFVDNNEEMESILPCVILGLIEELDKKYAIEDATNETLVPKSKRIVKIADSAYKYGISENEHEIWIYNVINVYDEPPFPEFKHIPFE